MTYYLSEYQSFDSVEDLNRHVDQYRRQLTATQFRVLWIVSNYACKFPGAAHLKAATIAAKLAVSTKTVYRALTDLERAGALVKHVTNRPVRGGQGATIYTVQPCVSTREQAVKSTERKAEASISKKETAFSFKKPFTSAKRTLPAAPEAPATFYELVKSLISDKKQRREYFTAYKKQVAGLLRFDIHADKAEMLDTYAIQALYIAIKRQEAGKVENPIGYFYGILRNRIDQALFSDMDEVYSANPDDLLAALPY